MRRILIPRLIAGFILLLVFGLTVYRVIEGLELGIKGGCIALTVAAICFIFLFKKFINVTKPRSTTDFW